MTTPKIIKSQEENKAALVKIEKLIDLDPEVGTPKRDELELLTLLVENYESKYKFRALTPMQAKTAKDIKQLKTTVYHCGNWSVCIDLAAETIHIYEYATSNNPGQRIRIPKSIHDEITHWYVTGDPEGEIGEGK